MTTKLFKTGLSALAMTTILGGSAWADEVSYVLGSVGKDVEVLQAMFKQWEEETGHTVKIVTMPASTSDQFAQYRLWLAAGTTDIDLYQTDVIWAPQLADHFVDLTEATKDEIGKHYPSVIESQTVDGKLVAMPLFTDAPALYYRKDLLEKYGKEVPTTWEELAATAQEVQDGERAAGANDLWGYVWQGNAYEGLTCNALEWVKSFGGGQIVEPDGTISINNENAAKAIDNAATWVGTISPPGVLSYQEEEARGVWQTGNSVFMRNWPYAYALSASDDSAVKDKFDVAPLPSGGAGSAATLGGWNVAVSKYSQHQEAAISLLNFLTGEKGQRYFAMETGHLPTVVSLYEDEEIGQKYPLIPRWKEVFESSVPRPSAPTKGKYNEVSAKFWSAVHETLSGNGTAAENLEILELDLEDVKGSEW